ncbi:MAG: hypothetical protein K9M51_02380 [Candidatus Gracilibacteria bacterium]|nr:hypothetical protein [Candidatus Gracilibacteria bacterium]
MSRQSKDFKKDIVFRTIEWGFSKDFFTKAELWEGLKLYPENSEDDQQKNSRLSLKKQLSTAFLRNSEYTAHWNQETIFYTSAQNNAGHSEFPEDTKFTLTTEAKFKYIDFLELEQARTNAFWAKVFSLISIGIALSALAVSAIISEPIKQQIFDFLF